MAGTRRHGTHARRWVGFAGSGAAAVVVLAVAVSPSGSGTASDTSSAGCPKPPRLDQPVDLDPRDFSATIDNDQWPMIVGSRWVYRVTDYSDGSVEHEVIRATAHTKLIADGITARVVKDVVTRLGKPVELTRDWYAQDRCGDVWYFGEHSTNYVRGHPRDNGSWEAGVGSNLPGVALPGKPRVGLSYREEYSPGVAEDQSRVLALDAQAEVPAGHFTSALMTEDFSPIEPNVSELKFYAPGNGQAVLAVDVSDGTDIERLISYTRRR